MADKKLLRFNWRGVYVDLMVDTEKCTLLDLVFEYEDMGKKLGKKLDYSYPTFYYVYDCKQCKLEKDAQLMTMFERLREKSPIDIWVGTTSKPNSLYEMVLNLKRQHEEKMKTVVDDPFVEDDADLLALDELDDTSLNHGTKRSTKKTKPVSKPKSKKTKPVSKPKSKPKLIAQPPPAISPKTAFKNLTVRRSPRFSPQQNITLTAPTQSLSDQSMFTRKIPRTTAKRKGVVVETDSGVGKSDGTKSARRKVEFFGESGVQGDELVPRTNSSDFNDIDDDSEGVVKGKDLVPSDELEDVTYIPEFNDNWKPTSWHDFVDDLDNDDDYYQRLYRNGDLYEEKEFGKIALKPWMIFLDKSHFKNTLKDYCIQEGFALTVISADNRRYTATCLAKCCEWRIHASRLADGVTWAIKKIDPNVHSCTGLETYNPLCNVKWTAHKLMEDIRANPDIPGKALNELLFQRFGVYMKQSTVYTMKKFAIDTLFGGHDASYGRLPTYVRVICDKDPEAKAYYSYIESESIPKQLLFNNIFMSFSAMWKGFLKGCRPLIGVDGTHLKGNYGGVLLSAVAMDGNNEIFPLAYAVVSVEDKENWSYFLWNLHNIVKDSRREDWTIISDRQKGIDLALEKVWPTAKRRYCCRHLSRNYKKQFSGPLMYILFWRACNATSQFTYRKAMERLQKAGGDRVMTWFAQLGDPSTWSKHKFDPNVCNESNTSNFVESFNSTLGVDRCRPILTLLEGIRRVCMVRMATRSQNALNWNDDDVCPTIAKMVKNTSKDIISCKAYMSKPGEYEIHEGKSHFPLSLNSKICTCGAWQLSGVPCRHAIRALIHAKIDPNSVVSSWYSVKTYKQAYAYSINPIPDIEQWPSYEDIPQILPPTMKRGVGRPCRNRRREEGEDQKGKRAKTVKCTKCNCYGHNARTCKGGLTVKEMRANGEPVMVRNPRVRDQSNAAKAAKAAAKAATKAAANASQASEINFSQFAASQSQSQV